MRTTKFTTEIVQANESFGGDLENGRPFVVHYGDRRQVTDEVVRRWPMFWQSDGTMLVPFEREVIEPEPEPKRKAVKRFRVKEQRIINIGNTPEAMVFKVGDVFPVDSEPYRLLSRELRRQILEEVK